MKIAIVIEIIDYHSGARAPLEIAKHLARLHHKVTIYAYSYKQDHETRKDIVKSGVSIAILNRASIPFIGKYITAFSLFKTLKNSSPEAIAFAGTLPFFLGSKLTNIPIVLMYHGAQPNAYLEKKNPDDKTAIKDKLINQIVNIYIYLVNGILIYLSKEVIAISKFAAKEAQSLYNKKVNAIIYLATTSFSSNKKVAKKEKNSVAILSVSRITPYKGFHLIIRALKNIKTDKKIIFTIAGSQPKNKYVAYLKMIGGKNIDIIIDPTDQSLVSLYQNSDIYVTADRYLYFGLPIFEAAQFSKPTISFNFAAASELIEHGKTGFIAENTRDFTRYAKKLIEDDNLREKLGKNAKRKSEQFSWEKCAKEWEEVLLNAIINHQTK